MNPVTAETRRFAEMYCRSSFVIAPLINGNEVFGALTAEYHSGRPMQLHDQHTVESLSLAAYNAIAKDELRLLDEWDRMLMSSISNFVNDTLTKIELFRDMERRIELRTSELRKTHTALLKAREMVIQSEKLSSLGRMAAGVIHEINDPLNFLVNILPELRADMDALIGAKEIIDREVKEPAVRARIQALVEKADLENHLQDMGFVFERSIGALNKSTGIANSLTVFTRGHRDANLTEVNLLEVAQAAVEMMPRKIRGETQIIIEKCPEAVWKVNRNQMEQVFLNLVNNAVEALDRKGEIRIVSKQDPAWLRVSVCDNGPGIPGHLQTKIFDPFFTTKPAGKSTGLGLSICAEIVRKFGGLLEVESQEGEGCCFHLRFLAGDIETGGAKAKR
jgi:signal transduction histidine kinase